MPNMPFSCLVGENYVEASGKRNYEFLALLECVATSSFPTRNVIYPIYSFDIEWQLVSLFYKGKGATFIQKLG